MTRWMSWDQLLQDLETTPGVLRRLIKQGKIQGLSTSRTTRAYRNWRFVDPGENLLLALKKEHKMYSNDKRLNILEFPVISGTELAALSGTTPGNIRYLVFKKKLKPYKIKQYSLFTPTQVREFILRRERKEPTSRRARAESVLRWCLNHILSKDGTMSREQIERDDALEGMLNTILKLKQPDRGAALREFWRRYQLSKDVVSALAEALAPDPPLPESQPLPADRGLPPASSLSVPERKACTGSEPSDSAPPSLLSSTPPPGTRNTVA